MTLNELSHLIDGLNAVQITLALRAAPSKQSVASQKNSLRSGITLHSCFEHQRQFKTGALPGKPQNLSPELAIEFFELTFAVRAGRDGDRPVRMQMIDVIVRNKCLERSIDGRGDLVFPES